MYKYKMFEFVTKWVIVLYNHITQYYFERPKIEIAKPILKRNHAEFIQGKPDAYKSIHASEYSYPFAPAGERQCKMTGIVGI